MCIVCNLGDNAAAADLFLDRFAVARDEMKAAAEAMLQCSRLAVSEVARRRYDRTHKSMTRAIREWNKLEEARENHTKGSADG